MKILTKKKEEKILKEECWNLDYTLIKWLNIHLKTYLEDGSRVVAFEKMEYRYKRKKTNLKELVEQLIGITNVLLSDNIYYDYDKEHMELIRSLVDEMYDILKLIHFNLWW